MILYSDGFLHLLGIAPGLMFPAIYPNTTGITTFEFVNSLDGYTCPRLRHLKEISHIYQANLKVNKR